MIDPSNMNELLEHYPVLRELPPPLLEELQREGQAVKAPAGTMLFNVGSACEAFPMLTSGHVRVERLATSGRKIVLYTVEPGDSCILTVSCLLGNTDYNATGITGSDITGVVMPGDVFMRFSEQSQSFRTFVFRFFSERIVHLFELIEGLAWEKVPARLAAMLANRPGVFEGTHQMLADELGSVREVVSRALKDFESNGLVKLGRGQIQILNREELKKIAAK
jgi:CRP/FNR family transcriptional regulator